jgi:hypothetical protein
MLVRFFRNKKLENEGGETKDPQKETVHKRKRGER